MNESTPNRNRVQSRQRGPGRSVGADPKKTGRVSSSNKGGAGRKRSRNKVARVDPAEFWGDPGLLPDATDRVTATPDVKAVIRSLGRPPVPGHETAAEHWLSLVYERAAVLAGALAAAGGLDDAHGEVSASEGTSG